ncbi:MAG: ribbon-helix-helix domain-containing protein [Candidatus Woesearchaeota archaeon]
MKRNVEAFSLPEIMRKQITSLIEAGYYSSRSDVIKDAFRTLLEVNPQLKIAGSVYLFKEKMISLDEALMISGKKEKEFLKIARKKNGKK